MLINPAYSGIQPEMEFSSNYKRSGTPDDEAFFEVTQASVIYPLRTTTSSINQIGGVGGTFFREKRGYQGLFTSNKFLLTGSYAIRLSQFINNYLVFGLQAGVVQNQITDEGLNWGSQFNQYFGFDNTLQGETLPGDNFLYPTVNFGLLYTIYDNDNIYVRDKSLIIGLSAEYLNNPKTGENSNLRKNTVAKLIGTFKMELSGRFYINPSALVITEGGKFQFNVGTYLSTVVNSVKSKTAVVLNTGGWYRLGDSFIVMGGFKINHLQIGASFDLNSSSVTDNAVLLASSPSYELSLTYVLTRKKDIRKVSNPIF